ncbi:hypothetical protein DERP_000134 [Dermatophagoides pteronyssinus]|uniref:Uncharacterized protein n=1 Tax=Dermatophagoides pteronyssinus TaxID=6956 RepID=A0ABQ8IZE6_DERPT|nr:hypothetical protein DERP_000134 [Dermatophagoides pteronyssinus]
MIQNNDCPDVNPSSASFTSSLFCLHQRYRYWTCHFWRRIISGEISLDSTTNGIDSILLIF